MASTIKVKRSSTASAVPSSLAEGELAANTTDGKLFLGKADTSVVEIGAGGGGGGGLDPTGDSMTGDLNMQDNQIIRPKIKDYAITFSAIGNTGATQTFDLTTANAFSATLDQASTFTFSNPPATGNMGMFLIELTNGGAFTITWPASVDWAGGTAPTLTTSGVDILVFMTRDGGTTWHGVVSSEDSN